MSDNNSARQRRHRVPIAAVEGAFHKAIDRLLAGKPTVLKLRRLAAEGRLNINPSTVALEAGHSRTLIALETCRLPSVRNRILSETRGDEIATPRTAAEVITRLREQIVQLKRELAAALEGQSEHFLARELAEREAAKWRDAFRRKEDHAREDATIHPIRPSRSKR